MIPLLAASLLLRAQGGGAILPKGEAVTVSDEVRDWSGFKYLPAGSRIEPSVFPVAGDWSSIKGDPAPSAVVWRTKIVILDRVDRAHERGAEIVWPGHHAITPPTVARIKRALPQLRALVADATGGAVDLSFDVSEETESFTIDDDLPKVVSSYLQPRINGGRYDAEDGVFRGPYPSVFVIHPVGGESQTPFEVQNSPVTLVSVADIPGEEADGGIATALFDRWRAQASIRAKQAGSTSGIPQLSTWKEWGATAQGPDAPTEARLRLINLPSSPPSNDTLTPLALAARGTETAARIEKDPQRGPVLTIAEVGPFRSGGFAFPTTENWSLDTSKTPALGFWMKSDAKDPVILQFASSDRTMRTSVRIGTDVPFPYDGAWHRVKVDLKAIPAPIRRIVVAPDASARDRVRNTLGPITASFSDFELTAEAPDARPTPEAPSATATDPEARAKWAASAGPGEARRALLRDPAEAVRANAVASALSRPDPADEPVLIEDALYTFEPTIYSPALGALAKLKTPTAVTALKQALRIAASERARGLAADILAQPGDAQIVPLLVGLNQARSRDARIEAIRALGRLAGSEAALMRMAYLAQEDPQVKLETTLTADPNDDYQARKLLWSAVNEPSDAVRLESLRRLSNSTVAEFQREGLKGIHDDSVGVRAGLLQAWTIAPNAAAIPAIRAAIGDRSPRVRAAALSALAASSAPIDAKDVPFTDPDPRVQAAASALGKAKGLSVPPPPDKPSKV